MEVVDARGEPVKTGRYTIRYKVEGAGVLEACGNGYHKDVHSFRNPDNGTIWHGRSMAILRPVGTPGNIRLTVESGDFPPAQLIVPVQNP